MTERQSVDATDLQNGLGALVVGIADVLKLVVTAQAVRLAEKNKLSEAQTDRLGQALYALDNQMRDVKTLFDMDPDEDIALKLGDIDGHEVNVVDILDSLIEKGVVLTADAKLALADVDLATLGLQLALREPDGPAHT